MRTKRLLCVDDDIDTLRFRKRLLEASGYSVLTASNGDDALRVLSENSDIDLALLDYLMPGMKGDELAHRLRARYPCLPLVAFSAVEDLPESLLGTVDACVNKSQDPGVLLTTIASVLAEHELAEGPEQKTILYVEDEELERNMRRMLFESAGYRVLEARSANAALGVFSTSNIDAVILDYWLPGEGGDGTALAEKMKSMRRNVPIVMLSGFAPLPGEDTIVDAWIRKGKIEPQHLLSEVERLIACRKMREENR